MLAVALTAAQGICSVLLTRYSIKHPCSQVETSLAGVPPAHFTGWESEAQRR